jgi:hypothetical protein
VGEREGVPQQETDLIFNHEAHEGHEDMETNRRDAEPQRTVKTFQLTYDWWQAVIDVEFPEAEPAIKTMVEFWSDWERHLERNDGDYTKTFLEMLGRELVSVSVDMRLQSALKHFRECEGWTPMDGTNGIKIISFDEWDWERDWVDIKELHSGKLTADERN